MCVHMLQMRVYMTMSYVHMMYWRGTGKKKETERESERAKQQESERGREREREREREEKRERATDGEMEGYIGVWLFPETHKALGPRRWGWLSAGR